ncbi:phenylalanine--tRNA ligase subunit beta [Patescibacteria group bacterium]|nr:phenylalanine--tRNA ligase subunit beta [Patescibacteria group bacterium]
MLFSYNWLQSFFTGRLPAPKKLAELLTVRSFEVEEVKRTGGPARISVRAPLTERSVAGKDWVLDINVTPNRGTDCLSHLGIARECGASAKLKMKNEKIKIKEEKTISVDNFINVNVNNSSDCPRYTGRVLVGVKVSSSPKYIQERLRACELEPINNIVDAANYVMLELGQPLHAFDLDKIEDQKIFIRRAKIKEKVDALDDKTYKLDKDNLVIADSKKVLAIAGIKGGKSTAIDKKTKNIFLESANFDSVLIRASSQKLGLKTDASLRFEHGMDPNLTELAVDRLAQLIQETAGPHCYAKRCRRACPQSLRSSAGRRAGGKIAKGRIDIYPKKTLSRKLKLDLGKIEGLLEIKIREKEAVRILNSLGLETKADLTVKIPTWRPDLAQNEDFAEEIGRIYGYEKLESSYPTLALIPAKRNDDIFWEDKIKDSLKEAGFSEAYNYSFISKRIGDMIGAGLVELKNPFSEEFYYLRPSLILNLFENIQYNIRNFSAEKNIKIFEIGKIFKQEKGEIVEKKMLSGVMAGGPESFYMLKGIIDSLFENIGVSDYYFDEYQATPEETSFNFWDRHRMAEIKIGGREIGFLGALNFPALLKGGKVQEVFAFDIDFEVLLEECSEESEYRPISKFPAAGRDISLLLPEDARVSEVLNIINASENKYIKDVDLFDFYEGSELPEGKKSLAFHIIFQAENRTLSGREIEAIMAKIIQDLENNLDWEVRKSA